MEISKNQKSFKFGERTDYIFYLSEMIVDLILKKDRMSLYLSEINQFINSNPKAEHITSELYESLSDKIMHPFIYILNLLGDESKKAVSYRKFRKLIYNHRNNLGIIIERLPQEVDTLLGQFNQLRNWGLHVPESFYIQKKEYFDLNSSFVLANKSRVVIPRYEYYEIAYLITLRDEMTEALSEISKIENLMKSDYKLLIEQDYKLEYEDQQVKSFLLMEYVENSWDIQNGRPLSNEPAIHSR